MESVLCLVELCVSSRTFDLVSEESALGLVVLCRRKNLLLSLVEVNFESCRGSFESCRPLSERNLLLSLVEVNFESCLLNAF